MTVKETILSFPGLDDCGKFLEKILVDRSVDGAANYSVSLETTVNLAAADLYAFVGGLPDFTENELSISYPRSWYTEKAKQLYRENGEAKKALTIGKQITVPRGKSGRSW